MFNAPLFLVDKIKPYFKGLDVFAEAMQLKGRVFRDVPGRKTIQVQLGESSYFVKQHFGVGWREIIKNLISFKLPIISAKTEKLAIEKLNRIGIATTPLAGFGERGLNPATKQSFIITEDLGDIVSLEMLCENWLLHPPTPAFKKTLITAVACLAGQLHVNGLNHRDFYLCHLCIDAKLLNGLEHQKTWSNQAAITLILIDLHRMLINQRSHIKSNMKDIAALFFSAMDIGLTTKDYLRFKHWYIKSGAPANVLFWQQVEKRAGKLYARFHSEKFQQKLANEKALLDQ